MINGYLYSGGRARGESVRLSLIDTGLRIERADGEVLLWIFSDLREQGSNLQKGRMVLSVSNDLGCFISFEDSLFISAVRARSGNLQLDFASGGRFLAKLWLILGFVALLVFLLVYFIIPRFSKDVSLYIPYSFEESLGEGVYESLVDSFEVLWSLRGADSAVLCEDASLVRPLESILLDIHDAVKVSAVGDVELQSRLSDVGIPRISIINSDEINAFALPGNRVVVFRGLLTEGLDSYDSLLGVLSHEVAHLMRGHAMEGLVSTSSVSLLLHAFAGSFFDSVLLEILASQALRASYTREMEAEADSISIAWTLASGGDPSRMREFFDNVVAKARVKSDDVGAVGDKVLPDYITDIFQTHPSDKSRIDNFSAFASPSRLAYGDYEEYRTLVLSKCSD